MAGHGASACIQSQQAQSAALSSSSVGGGDGRSACQTSLGRAPIGFRIARPFGFVGDDATLGHALRSDQRRNRRCGADRLRPSTCGIARSPQGMRCTTGGPRRAVSEMASAEWMASARPNRRGDDRTGEVERGSCVPPVWQQCVVPSRDASRTLLSRVSPTTALRVAA
jgi:hypothetical protein